MISSIKPGLGHEKAIRRQRRKSVGVRVAGGDSRKLRVQP